MEDLKKCKKRTIAGVQMATLGYVTTVALHICNIQAANNSADSLYVKSGKGTKKTIELNIFLFLYYMGLDLTPRLMKNFNNFFSRIT